MEKLLTRYLLSHMGGIKSFYLTSEHYAYDAVAVTKSEITTLIETKVRDNKIDVYPDYILEVEKLEKLVNAAKPNNHKILYINFFKTYEPEKWDYIIFNITGRIRKWDEEKPEVKCIYANDKTFVSKQNKRDKWVILLKYDESMDQRGQINLNQK